MTDAGAMCAKHPDHYDGPCSACAGHPCCVTGRLVRLARDMVDAGDAKDERDALRLIARAVRPAEHVTITVGDSRGGPGSAPPGVPFGMVQEAYELGRRRR